MTRSKNDSSSVALKVAVVAGVFGVAATLVTLLAQFVSYKQSRNVNVVATDISAVQVGARRGLNLAVENNSDIPASVTHIYLEFWQSGSPAASAGWKLYEFVGSVDKAGRITGSTQTSYPGLMDSVKFPATGSLKLYNAGGWQLQIATPLREEIPANGHLWLTIILPVTLQVIGDTEVLSIGAINARTYISQDGFQLLSFLQDRGKTGLSLRMNYDEGRTAKYKGSITF